MHDSSICPTAQAHSHTRRRQHGHCAGARRHVGHTLEIGPAPTTRTGSHQGTTPESSMTFQVKHVECVVQRAAQAVRHRCAHISARDHGVPVTRTLAVERGTDGPDHNASACVDAMDRRPSVSRETRWRDRSVLDPADTGSATCAAARLAAREKHSHRAAPLAMLDTLPEAKRTAGPIDAITCEAPVSE